MPDQDVAIRVAAVGVEVCPDLIVPPENLTVGGALDELVARGGTEFSANVILIWNGRVSTRETEVTHGGALVIIPDKPTGNGS